MSADIRTSLLQLIEDYNRVNTELNKELHANGKEFFKAFFQQLFNEHTGLNKIAILGWTPGFNDGEPCTHSSEVFVGRSRYNSPDYEDYSEVGAFFTDNEDYEYGDGLGENPNALCTTLTEVYEKIWNFDDIIERVYDTNFIIKAFRGEDGVAVVEIDEYDCGY